MTTPSTKRNIIVPCTLEVTINFSRYITALKSEFKKLRWLLQQKRQFTVKLQVRLLGYSMLVTLCKISEVYFCLLAAKDFRVKTKNGRFTSTGSRCRKKLQYENLTSLFCKLGQKLPQKACSAIILFLFLHSTKEITDLWLCRCRCRRQLLNSPKRACANLGKPEVKWFS